MSDFSRLPQEVLVDNVGKEYVGLHLQQGVPILDRDLNLLQDLITATVRSIVTRFIGNGIPTGREGFGIQPGPVPNDFRILAGAPSPGICLVDGIVVRIPADLDYTDQPRVPALTTPTAAQPDPREDTVYLDVSIETVDGAADADLLNPDDIGIQTSVRLRPTWTVRVAENRSTPPAPDAGHAHLALARLARRRNVSEITAAMVTDLRQTRLTLGDVERRLTTMERLLVTPVFDASPAEFSPKVGSAGQTVNLRGRNLNLVPVQVLFGAIAAPVTSVGPTQIATQVPGGASGSVRITVITTGGSVVSEEDFTVLGGGPAPTLAPSPNQFSPKAGGAGTSVTVFGTNLNVAPVSVLFGANVANVVSSSATQIVAQVPTGVSGPVKLTVTTGGGTVVTADDFVAGPPPAFAASPNQFSPKVGGAGVNVTLSGSNFNASPVSVQFGAVPAQVISFNASQIATQVPVGAATGAQKIAVTTATGTVLSNDNFTVLA